MVLLIDEKKCQQCWTCSVKSDLNGLPEMAYEGLDISNWPEQDSEILGMIMAVKEMCPNKAMSIITKNEFCKMKRGVDDR